MSLPLDLILPHRAPMRWIDALIECAETTACATARFSPDHFAADGSHAIETALVECMAQTVAAAQGHRALQAGGAGGSGGAGGMLAAVSNFQLFAPPAVGQALQIRVREVKRFGPMLMVEGEISSEGKPIASGALTLYA